MVFHYNSVQSHTEIQNGKLRTKTTRVTIRGKKGTKSVEIRTKPSNGKLKTQKSKKKLTSSEMKCIPKCQFVPGLFKDCWNCIKHDKLPRKI